MNLIDLRKEVENDLKFDESSLDSESLKIPQLHSKYLNFLTDSKLKIFKYQKDYDSLYRKKWEYYTGKLSDEELKNLNWPQFQLKLLRTDVDMYLKTDEDLQNLETKILIEKEKFNYIESIIKGIMNRHWMIRSAIDFRKFISGVG